MFSSRLHAGSPRRRRWSMTTAAVIASSVLVIGLSATPAGAAGLATATGLASSTATPPPETTPPAPTATPSDDDTAANEGVVEEAPDTETESPKPDPATPPDTGPEEPTATEDPAPAVPDAQSDEQPTDTPERAPPVASRMSAASIGILAAGIPEQPTQVWIEQFEQGVTATAASSLSTYAGPRYSASQGWVNGTSCTGVIVNHAATYPNAQLCPSQSSNTSTLAARETRRLADVLAQAAAGTVGSTSATAPANGSTATTRGNHALVALPYATVAGGTTVAQSTAGIGITASGSRYYTMRFDAAAAPCTANNPALSLALVNGTTVLLNAFPTAVNPCAATGPVFYTSPALAQSGGASDPAISASARAATYTGTVAALLTPAQVSAAQVRLLNTTTGTGSGFAVDNLRVLDATPSLDWSFDPASVPLGTPTTLTYTLTNTRDLLAKSDWSFTNTLPTGIAVAPNPAVGGTCVQVTGTAFSVTATAGASSISTVGGDLAANTTSCTITVDVVGTAEGSFTNAPANMSSVLTAPESATLTVTPATRLTLRKALAARLSSTDQFTVSVRSGSTVLASATTTGSATGVQAAQVSRLIVDAGATYTIHETPTAGAGLGYASTYECTRDGTVVASGASRSGTLTMPADSGAEIVCTFTNSVQQTRLTCDSGLYYGLTATGGLIQGDTVSGAQTTVGTWPNVAAANSLGVGSGGTLAYALNRSTDATSVLSILKWSSTGGFESLANSAYTTLGPGGTAVAGSIVAGAVDLTNGRYLFGKFNAGQFYLWSFTESAPAASRFAYLGTFATGTAPNGNGDMAFDSRGNLYVLGAATVNNVSSAAIFTVTAETLAAANGGTLAVNTSTTRPLTGIDASPAFGSVNGIAFSPRGTVYLSSNTSTYEFDPTSWTRIAGSPRVDFASTDLGTCTGPGSVTVQKNVVGRAAAADQFQITLADATGTVGTATTTGSTTGRQSAQVGPFPVRVGTALTVSEAMATGSSSVIGAYTVRLECWTDGVRIANTNAATANLTMPDRFGANVVCTFFNSPSPVATVTVTKRVLDPATGQSAVASGWTLGTAAAATTGTATVLPSESPRQVTDASGTATWTVLYGSAASRATLTISEAQQPRFTFVSGSCTVNGANVAITFTTVGGVVSGTIPGVGPSATVACILINQPVTSLTLVKQVSFGSASAADWTLTATAPTTPSGALPGPSGRTGTTATTAVAVSPARAYRLSETGGTATYVQSGPWRCVDAAGAQVTVSAAGDVTLATGAAVTCTVTNATSSMTLLKTVTTPGPGFVPSTWTVTATPAALAGATLPTQSRPGAAYDPNAGNAASTFEVRPGHSYTLSEAPTVAGTRLSYQTLRLERLDGTTWTTVTDRTIVAPAAGQSVVYRFVNAPVLAPTLPLTGGMGSDTFLIAGAVVLAITAAGAFLHRRRREGGVRFR